MWSPMPCEGGCGEGAGDAPAPAARAKHSATLLGRHVYLLGGRALRVPMRDLWRYSLVEGVWEQLRPGGDRPPTLQEHTAVAHAGCLWVFGGQLAHTDEDTPFWCYHVAKNTWRKLSHSAGQRPRGRRGHSAVVRAGCMLLYGGYRDLRGSTSEMWAFHFESESWHLVSTRMNMSGGTAPARHKHSAVLHDGTLWVYGGMQDLNERGDLWRYDTDSRIWHHIRSKVGPGARHSHAACCAPGTMFVFGGEAGGRACADLWRLHFGTETWEKIFVPGVNPSPRTESVALAISEWHLQGDPCSTPSGSYLRSRSRLQRSHIDKIDKTARHSLHLPQNRVLPCEKTYVCRASNMDYIDGSGSNSSNLQCSVGFLKEISKLSQINIPRMGQNRCNYTVLTSNNDSTESLLRHHASGSRDEDNWTVPPAVVNKSIVKSQSEYVINKRKNLHSAITSPTDEILNNIKEVPSAGYKEKNKFEMTREPISVPNFADITLPTPVLSPVEAAKLVYFDSEEEALYNSDNFENLINEKIIHVKPANNTNIYTTVNKDTEIKRDDTITSHLSSLAESHTYENVPKLVSVLPKSASVRFQTYPDLDEVSEDNSTSDYASIEGVNRMVSYASNQSVSTRQSLLSFSDNQDNKVLIPCNNDTLFGFCNPNYMGPDIQTILSNRQIILEAEELDSTKIHIAKLLNTPDSGIMDGNGKHFAMEDMVELKDMKSKIDSLRKDNGTKVIARVPPKTLAVEPTYDLISHRDSSAKLRAKSASRAERRKSQCHKENDEDTCFTPDIVVPIYVYIIGGREQGQAEFFKRPLSMWKFQLL